MLELLRTASILLAIAPQVPAAAPTAPEPEALKFYAYDHDPQGHFVDRAGVLCVVLRAGGADELGRTNEHGEIVVPYSKLFKPENLAVMFCPGTAETPCTAVRLDTGFLRGFEEFNVRVTSFEIIDRMTVGGPEKHARR